MLRVPSTKAQSGSTPSAARALAYLAVLALVAACTAPGVAALDASSRDETENDELVTKKPAKGKTASATASASATAPAPSQAAPAATGDRAPLAPAAPSTPADLVVRARIDGQSLLIVSPKGLRWHHVAFASPGRQASSNDPTFANGTAWMPAWPDAPSAENRDCNCESSLFDAFTRPSALAQSVTLENLSGRSRPTIVQQPDGSNGFETIVAYDDSQGDGADWYEVRLTYR